MNNDSNAGDTGATRTMMTAGTLTLTVWPEAPVGEHQRYGYRIADTATGGSIEGRDLFTGAEAPVEPDLAIKELAGFLTAAGEARQYAIDHPGHTAENEGLFPEWVAEAARTNSAGLAGLIESIDLDHDPSDAIDGTSAVGEPELARRWISVVFLQGADADDVLDLIDREGTDAAIEHLAGYYYGEDTVQEALENGYVYDDLPTGTVDEVAVRGVYTLTYNHHLGHVSLLREFDALPDPVLLGIEDPAPAPEQAPAPAADPSRGAGRAVDGPGWFGRSTGQGGSRPGLGL